MNFHALAPKCYKRSVVEGLVYRIHRACSHWKYFDESLSKGKSILEQNQYPPQFYDPIIKNTISKILNPQKIVNVSNESSTSQKIMTFLPYRGKMTDRFVKKLKDSRAPIQPIITLTKLKTTLPSLKSQTKVPLRSRVVYKISCPGCETCYVGQTRRHLITRFREHKNTKAGAVRSHFTKCIGSAPGLDDLKILASSFKCIDHLLALEALFIRELNPKLNTKDEYRSRELRLRF